VPVQIYVRAKDAAENEKQFSTLLDLVKAGGVRYSITYDSTEANIICRTRSAISPRNHQRAHSLMNGRYTMRKTREISRRLTSPTLFLLLL
jgi:hypothetical protein